MLLLFILITFMYHNHVSVVSTSSKPTNKIIMLLVPVTKSFLFPHRDAFISKQNQRKIINYH